MAESKNPAGQGGASETLIQAAELNTPEDTQLLHNQQARRLRRRAAVSFPMALVLAGLIFGEARPE